MSFAVQTASGFLIQVLTLFRMLRPAHTDCAEMRAADDNSLASLIIDYTPRRRKPASALFR
jgi:hypothetical protein